jgi:hypothetical protein
MKAEPNDAAANPRHRPEPAMGAVTEQWGL